MVRASSSRRRMLDASAKASSGPTREPSAITDSAQMPSGPESTSAATNTDASTTVVNGGRGPAPTVCPQRIFACPPQPCGRGRPAATFPQRAWMRCVQARPGETPALTAAAEPHGLLTRLALPRGRLGLLFALACLHYAGDDCVLQFLFSISTLAFAPTPPPARPSAGLPGRGLGPRCGWRWTSGCRWGR